MISFTIITSTPAVLRNQLIARDIIKEEVDRFGQTQLVGVREGLEWIEVPNPIVKTLAVGTRGEIGYVPPVMDTRRCYLVKLVRAAEGNEESGLQQTDPGPRGPVWRSLLQRTQLGQWILNNSVGETLTSADGRSWQSRRVGTNFWGVISDDFGVWQ